MADDSDDRFDELRRSGEVMGKLAGDEKAFLEAVEAFQARDAERFQGVLDRVGILDGCRLVCRFLCSKHCVFVCFRLAGELEGKADPGPQEWLEFATFTRRLAEDEALLRELVRAVDEKDEKAYRALLDRLDAWRFAHQLCHWLCRIKCRRVCELLCPPPPLITAVAFIPTGQIPDSGPGAGLAAGPSFPPGPTPVDVKSPGGVGDHPFGGLVNIKGVFNTPGATQYKVEFTPTGGGGPTAITTPVQDYEFNPGFPPPPIFLYYTRVATSDWYTISEMGLDGIDYLTDWVSTAVPDGEYDLTLTVRTASLAERTSLPVRVVIDNTTPDGPGPGGTPIMTISQGGKELGCCESVTRDGGPITIHIEGEDLHFSSLDVTLYGGCNVSSTIFSKTYNGNLNDHGAPAPGIDITWDPWKEGLEPCCYVIFFRIYDRAILNDYWNGGNTPGATWHSITVA